MKIAAFFLLLTISLSSAAQDIILLTNGEEVTGKVNQITLDKVIYAAEDGLSYFIPLNEVFLIKYENGARDVFTQNIATGNSAVSDDQKAKLFLKGLEDAEKMYPAKEGFAEGFALGFFVPKIGSFFLPRYASDKKVYNQRKISAFVKDPGLKNDPDYMSGYEKGVKNKNLKRAVRGYTTGTVANTVVIYMMIFALIAAI
jgi:hypothetical protein